MKRITIFVLLAMAAVLSTYAQRDIVKSLQTDISTQIGVIPTMRRSALKDHTYPLRHSRDGRSQLIQ